MSDPHHAAAVSADASWIESFLETHPPESGVPPGFEPAPLPPLIFVPPRKPRLTELIVEEYEPKRSRPIRKAWQGRFQSLKQQRSIPWRSQLVFELFCQWEVDRGVTEFDYRPTKFRLGRKSFVPNAFANVAGQAWFTHVSWVGQITKAKMAIWKLFGEALADSGFGFQLLTDEQIRSEPRSGNAAFLIRALPAGPPAADVRALACEVLLAGPLTVREFTGRPELSIKTFAQLVLAGVIAIDLDRPIGPTTVVSSCQQ